MPENQRVTVAVDAMGGDGGCRVAVDGAIQALSADETLVLHLVGKHSDLESAVATISPSLRERMVLHDAGSVLPMDVSTSGALRQGRGSSMQLALDRLAGGEVEAVVSAGSTGALMALSRQTVGMLPGIERPALMAAVPGAEQPVWVLDLGANVGVDAHRLLEFARLGHVAVHVLTGREPRTGLLNIGQEPGKGPDVLREAARLIDAEREIDYTGFVEADAVFAGAIDLVVCDGFAGNILLKGVEGMVRLVFSEIDREFARGPTGWLARRRLRKLHDRLDPAMHNGAPLLGVRGTVIKSHGAACARGFAAAIRLAALEARRDLIPELERRLWASY